MILGRYPDVMHPKMTRIGRFSPFLSHREKLRYGSSLSYTRNSALFVR